jgi:glycosyltransferase involved in cell wall biosynthesis
MASLVGAKEKQKSFGSFLQKRTFLLPGIEVASLGLVRRLPAPLQRAVVRGAERLRLFLEERASNELPDLNRLARLPPRSGRATVGKRVAVAGLFGVRSGLQRGADLDLQARGIDVLAFDLTAALKEPANLPTRATGDFAALIAFQPTDIVIHINPPLFARAITLLPEKLRNSTVLIGYWAWELNVLPASWQICATATDEIWCPSPFTAEALKQGLPAYPGAISVVPHAADRDSMPPIPPDEREALRTRFALPPTAFIAGFSFSFNSNYARKNPAACIEAFRLAFPADADARLIIRCNDVAGYEKLFTHLRSLADNDPRILVWNNSETGIGIKDFYGLLDLYVSLHRSEGYGLNLVEAAQAGLAVIATGWGLAPDIAARPGVHAVGFRLVFPLDPQGTYDSDPNARWAEPDLIEAAETLKRLSP